MFFPEKELFMQRSTDIMRSEGRAVGFLLCEALSFRVHAVARVSDWIRISNNPKFFRSSPNEAKGIV